MKSAETAVKKTARRGRSAAGAPAAKNYGFKTIGFDLINGFSNDDSCAIHRSVLDALIALPPCGCG
jgi:hypothetical protein